MPSLGMVSRITKALREKSIELSADDFVRERAA